MRNKILIILSVLVVLIYLNIRNNNVFRFRTEVLIMVANYNEHHYYNQIRSLDQVMPGYNVMLLSVKPLKYKYWIDKETMTRLTKNNDVVI